MTEKYAVQYANACPESVHVQISRNGAQVRAFQVRRKAAGSRDPEVMESVRNMLNRAEIQAKKWVEEDRDARQREYTLNTSGDARRRSCCGDPSGCECER